MRTKFKRENIRFGITPTGWWNDDFLDIDIGIPFEQCVSEMALAGFEGCSVGHKYPTNTAVLKWELDLRGLRVSEPWTSTYFTIAEMHQKTVDDFRQSLDFIKTMGGTDLVVAELGGSSHQLPVALVPNRPVLTERQWDSLTSGLNELGQLADDAGMRLCYHHHMGTGVMIGADVDRLMAATDPRAVNLLVDTGHILFAGTDPLTLIRRHAKRIKHVHLKNIRRSVMESSLQNNLSFKESILAGVFTVPGDPEGCIDFPPILEALAESDFEGWLVVEAEQDPGKKPPLCAKGAPLYYAKMARDYLRGVIGF